MQHLLFQSTHHLPANISLNHDFPKADQQFRSPFQFSPPHLDQILIIHIQAMFQNNKLPQQLSFQPSVAVVTPFTQNPVSQKLNPHQSRHSSTQCCHLEAHTPHPSVNLTHQIKLHHNLCTIQPHRPQANSAANICLEILEVMLVLLATHHLVQLHPESAKIVHHRPETLVQPSVSLATHQAHNFHHVSTRISNHHLVFHLT